MAPPSPPRFDITPEHEASKSRYFYRQFFVKTPALSAKDAQLHGKTVLITGGNTGLGLETARQLIDLGVSHLVIAVRNTAKGEAARKELVARRPASPCTVDVWALDLSSYDSVVALADRADKELQSLDVAILNAALYKITETFNPSTGYEEDVQVNYLSNALLATLLLPVLKSRSKSSKAPGLSAPPRLVLLSSDAAGWVEFTERTSRPLLAAFKTNRVGGFAMQERYGTSKLLGQLFLTELASRVPAEAVTLVAVNPGFCYGSELGREGNGSVLGFLVDVLTRIIGKPPVMGVRPIIHATAGFGAGKEVHGRYIEDGLLRPMAPIIYRPDGEEIAKLLWDETMAELSFAGVEAVIRDMGK
ncbi:putative short-chain dehydrogenase [Bombardia bombarda]|uniref:Short-chain dehydrogenase n=1 Tax=Bombardia bombarda TaxID=252184 RepID=A0AA39WUX6_9PEZI|nr:putative short-chain dehydrogenase [Bombardia bombarda]